MKSKKQKIKEPNRILQGQCYRFILLFKFSSRIEKKKKNKYI